MGSWNISEHSCALNSIGLVLDDRASAGSVRLPQAQRDVLKVDAKSGYAEAGLIERNLMSTSQLPVPRFRFRFAGIHTVNIYSALLADTL